MTSRSGTTAVVRLLQEWLPRQRWFAAKGGGEPVLTPTAVLPLRDGEVRVAVHLVTAEVDGRSATYQLPLTFRRNEAVELSGAAVGTVEDDEGQVFVYDAPHDPAFVTAWLEVVARETRLASTDDRLAAVATGELQPGTTPPDTGRPCRVLSGEQSNTSIIVSGEGDPNPLIIKLFRVLQAGANPDVAVTSVLTGAGCRHVPRLTGWIDGEWVDALGERARGHLASVSEFLPEGEDAWRSACVAVQQGRSFADEAEGIGAATAAVHAALADNLSTRPSDGRTLHDLADHLQERLSWAVEAVPELAPHADGAREMIEAVRTLTGTPRLQRVHGDLHLGQVLDAGERGWILLDFEGEPLRPLADRNRPDLVHRDLAGMLRSFDYAARHTVLGLGPDDPRHAWADTWVEEACATFLSGYAAGSGHDPGEARALLRALELDKALYEVVYESRNRPAWVELPLRAVHRLLNQTAAP